MNEALVDNASSLDGVLNMMNKGCVHTVALPFALKKYLEGKRKNYGNSNISPCKNIIL
jgi:hypothetical protein